MIASMNRENQATGGRVQQQIESKLAAAIPLDHLEVINESGNHQVPPGAESHFKVVLVSRDFEGIKLLQRHRRVNDILRDELSNEIHALAIHAYTEAEWLDRQAGVPMSPPCAKKPA